MNKVTKYFHADNEHGWLAVKSKEIVELGLTDTITDFSYAKGKTVYLEEDKDAQVFLSTAKAKGIDIEVKNAKVVKRSNIRGFQRFSDVFQLGKPAVTPVAESDSN